MDIPELPSRRRQSDGRPVGRRFGWSACLAALALLMGACSGATPPSVRDVRVLPGIAQSAHRVIFWTNCSALVQMSQPDLEHWKQAGVGGFACESGHLAGEGGSQHFSDNPDASLEGPQYALQRTLRDTHFVARVNALGMKIYLGFYLANNDNTATPLVDWFDDKAWRILLPQVTSLASVAKRYGFAGLAFDQELYPQSGGVSTATWDWDYPGNSHPQSSVRAEAEQRGRAMMSAILRGFPEVQIAAYDVDFPGTWHDYVQRVVNGIASASENSVQIDFWSGLTSVTGYSAIRLYDADFYKATQTDADWDTALRYEYSHLASVLSKRFANWDYVSQRFYESPFSWIDGDVANEGAFTAPRTPGYVGGQLRAFRTWGMGGEFANYAYAPLSDFDYGPYLGALRDASQGGSVKTSPPTLNVSTATVQPSCRATIAGAASDPLAVWAVNWRTSAAHGSAQLTPKSSLVGANATAAVSWVADGVSLQPGTNDVTLTAIDIKGLTRQVTSRVHCPS